MRTDLWESLGAALRAGPPPVVIAASDRGPLRRLTDALGDRPVVVAGEAARYAIARGIAAEGGRPIVALGTHVRALRGIGVLGVTTDAAASAQALKEGWFVLRPALSEDVATLLDEASDAVVLQMGPAAAADEATPSPARWAPRIWRRGDHVTLAVSGAVLDVVLPVARMLSGRGVHATVVELAALTRPELAPLTATDAFFAGPPGAEAGLEAGTWPDGMQRVEVLGRSTRHLMDAVLGRIPAEAGG